MSRPSQPTAAPRERILLVGLRTPDAGDLEDRKSVV